MNPSEFYDLIGSGQTGGTVAIAEPLVFVRSEADKVAADLMRYLIDTYPTMTHAQLEESLQTALFWSQLWSGLLMTEDRQ